MATKRISALTAAGSAALTDQIPIENVSNATRKLTLTQIAALLVTGSTVNTALGYTAANAAALNASSLTSGTVPLARVAGITTTQLDPAAAIAHTQIATLDAAKLSTGAVPTPRLGEGNAHELGGLGTLAAMWLGAPPVSLAVARTTGLATSITVNGVALQVARPAADITRIGGLATAPAFTRASVANNPETGAQAASGAVRYQLGRNLVSAAQSNCSAGWALVPNGANAMWAHNGNEIVGTVTTTLAAESFSEIRLNGARWSNLAVTFSADIEITGHTAGTVTIDLFDTVGASAAETRANVSAGNVNSRYSVTRTLRGNLDNDALCIRLRVTLPAGTNAGTVVRIRRAQFEFGASASSWTTGGNHAILIERGATNLLGASAENFTTGWSTFDGSTVTVTGGQADPFGGTAAYRVQCTAGGGTNVLKYLISDGVPANGIKHSTSVLVKSRAGTVTINTNMPGNVDAVVTTADGWRLVKIENLTGNGSAVSQLRLNAATAGGTIDCDVMWPQIEVGTTCTSYIAPGTTRQPDSETLPAVCNPAEGAVIVRAYVAGDQGLATSTQGYVLFDAWQLATTNRLILYRVNSGWLVVTYGAASGFTQTPTWSSALTDGWHTFAAAWKDGILELYVDGTLRGTSTYSAVLPTSLPNAVVGRSGTESTAHYNLPIAAVHIYDRHPGAAALAALTVATLGDLPAHPAESFRQTYQGVLDYTARVVDVTSASGLVTAAARATAAIAV
jgi:hypothetical protein